MQSRREMWPRPPRPQPLHLPRTTPLCLLVSLSLSPSPSLSCICLCAFLSFFFLFFFLTCLVLCGGLSISLSIYLSICLSTYLSPLSLTVLNSLIPPSAALSQINSAGLFDPSFLELVTNACASNAEFCADLLNLMGMAVVCVPPPAHRWYYGTMYLGTAPHPHFTSSTPTRQLRAYICLAAAQVSSLSQTTNSDKTGSQYSTAGSSGLPIASSL